MNFISRLNPFSGWSSTTSQPANQTQQANTAEPEIVAFIKQLNLDKAPPALLHPLRFALKQKKIVHPICQQLDEKISKAGHSALGFSPKLKTHSVGLTASDTSYIQPYGITPEETIKALEPLAGKLDEIEICEPNDNLMAFIAEKFPNLKSLVIQEKLQWWFWNLWEALTDKGLESIGKLQHLKRLDLKNSSMLFSVTRLGFEKLLNLPHLTANVEELGLEFMGITIHCLPIIAGYQKLKKLHIGANNIDGGGLYDLLKSPTLQKSLIHFSFYNYWRMILDDTSIKLLQKFANLQHLILDGTTPGMLWPSGWNVSEPALLEFLESQKKLLSLTLQDPTITDAVAEKLNQMTGLTQLSLKDCSKVYTDKGWSQLLGNKLNLTHLELGKLGHNDLSLISLMPLKFLSLETGFYGWISLNDLCQGRPLQDNLKTLHLGNITNGADWYKPLPQLKNLTALRLDKCVSFNNDALETIYPLSESLETLELGDVPLDDRAIKMFSNFKKLQNLFLVCRAWTKQGIDSLLHDKFLKKHIQCIETMDFDYNDEQAFQFKQFDNIKILILDTDSKMSDEGEKNLQAWAWKNKVRVFFPGSGRITYNDFENGLKAIQ